MVKCRGRSNIDQHVLVSLEDCCMLYFSCLLGWQCLLKFTDSEHGGLVAVSERPESVYSAGLTNLHRDAVAPSWDRPCFPVAILWRWPAPGIEKHLPIWPTRCGGVKVWADINALPPEDAHILRTLALQPDGVLREGGWVVKLVIHVLNQAVQLGPWLENNQFAFLTPNGCCLMQTIIWHFRKKWQNIWTALSK